MSRRLAVGLIVLLSAPAAFAGPREDCENLRGDAALRACDVAIKQNARDAKSYINRGVEYQVKGDMDRAIADYSKAIEINPKEAQAYTNRGIAYAAKGNTDRAIADYTKAIEIDPKYARAYSKRGDAYSDKKDYARAIGEYTKAIEINPKDAQAYNSRGVASGTKGDTDRAIADYTKAIEIDPKYAWAYKSRGDAYYDKKDYDRAIADFTKAIEINPGDAGAYDKRANAYEKSGAKGNAIADHTRILTLKPDHVLSKQAIKRLQSKVDPFSAINGKWVWIGDQIELGLEAACKTKGSILQVSRDQKEIAAQVMEEVNGVSVKKDYKYTVLYQEGPEVAMYLHDEDRRLQNGDRLIWIADMERPDHLIWRIHSKSESAESLAPYARLRCP